MNISIGPAPTNWGRKRLKSFYQEIGRHPAVTRVYIGEISCTKRNILDAKLLLELENILREKGKEVVLSTYVLPTNSKDLQAARELIKEVQEIEINNIGVLNMWTREFPDKKATLGPFLNLYNSKSIYLLKKYPIKRVVLPVDLKLDAALAIVHQNSLACEIIVGGRVPIAFSWRCYTARAYNRIKKNCRFKCYEVPEISLKTLDDEPLFAINGLVIFSGKTDFLPTDLKKYKNRFAAVRIEPHPKRTIEMVEKIEDWK